MAATAVAIVLGAAFSDPVAARMSGIIDYSGNPDAGGGATCLDCHAPGADTPIMQISGPGLMTGGETGDFTVRIIAGPGQVGGFNASVSDLAGTLIADDVETRLAFSQITHTAPKPFADGSVAFTFQWTAPIEAGEVVLHAAGLSANGDGGNGGDGVAGATFPIQIIPPPLLGDVNCSGEQNIVDALVIAQFDTEVRTDGGSCPLQDPLTQLVASQGDVNGDQSTNVIDALLIAQCDVDIDNGFCLD